MAKAGIKSGRQDSNLRPFDPQSNALPDCATARNSCNASTYRYYFRISIPPLARVGGTVMPEKPIRPRYRKARKCWFVCLHGKQHNLGPDKEEAHKRFHSPPGCKLHFAGLGAQLVRNAGLPTQNQLKDRLCSMNLHRTPAVPGESRNTANYSEGHC